MTKAKMVSKALPRLPRGAVSLKSPAAGPPFPSRGGGGRVRDTNGRKPGPIGLNRC